MAFAMTIGGIDVMPYLDVDSLDFSTPLNARHTLGAVLQDQDAIYRPQLLEEVIFTQDGDRIFAGYVVDAKEVDWAAEKGIATDVTIGDYSVRLERVYLTLAMFGTATAPTATLAGLGAGSVTNGTHSYKVQVFHADGRVDVSPASNVVTTTSGNGKVTVLVPVVIGAQRYLYRTTAGNAGPWKLVTTFAADDVTPSWVDNVADGSLGASLGTALRDVIDAIFVSAGLGALGFTRDPLMSAGPTIEVPTFTDIAVTEAFNTLSTLSGWPWRTDYLAVVKMGAIGSESAPAGLTEGPTPMIIGDATQTVGQYGNRQVVRIGSGEHDVADTFVGDDVATEWPLTYDAARTYGYVTVLPANTIQTLGIVGEGEAPVWNWRRADNVLVRTGGALASGQSVVITYAGQFPYSVVAKDDTEIGLRGRWDRPPVSLPEVFDAVVGQAYADALIRRYAIWPPPRTVKVVIWDAGFVAGQQVALTSTTRNLFGSWLITDVDTTVDNGMFLRYTLTLLEGDEQQASWREFWRGLAGGTASGGSIVGGVAVGGTTTVTTAGAYEAGLGGSSTIDVSHTTWSDVPESRDWVCPADGVYVCRAQVWTSNAGTSVTPRLYDMTAGAAAVTGTASTSLTKDEQLLSFTGTTGHRYSLQVLPSNTSAGVFGVARVEAINVTGSFVTPAIDAYTKGEVDALLAALWPVGAVFVSEDSTNPAALGLPGTWVETGVGRVLVGQDVGDADFDTLGETGGSK